LKRLEIVAQALPQFCPAQQWRSVEVVAEFESAPWPPDAPWRNGTTPKRQLWLLITALSLHPRQNQPRKMEFWLRARFGDRSPAL